MSVTEEAAVGGGRANLGRVGAVKALIAVEQGAHVEDALADMLPPEGQDRALGWNIAFGVLRHRGQIDAALRPWLRQPIESLDEAVRATLRAGVYERIAMRTPVHASVDQGVEIVRALGMGKASGLVNAVLRRAEAAQDLSRSDALDHPAWLVARWDARYGKEATEAWCLANGQPPPLFVVARDDVDALSAELTAAGFGNEAVEIQGEPVFNVLRMEGRVGRVEELPGWTDGKLWIQDAASAWMCDLVPESAKTVLDACAAPGGKTMRLAARGAVVTACDQSASRLKHVVTSAERLKVAIKIYTHDWMEGPHRGLGNFDCVLVDAPCTGLGTVRRRPEIRWRRAPMDPMKAAVRQRAILENVWDHVNIGGHLVYVVCSAEPEEGPAVVKEFLAKHPEFSLELERGTAPPENGEDAFYGARMVRR